MHGEPAVDYRASHSTRGYARTYARTYESGFYQRQWETIERPLVERLLRARADAGATTLIDFACGTGRITELATRLFPSVVGVDVAPEMLAAARARCPAARFLEVDITRAALCERADVVTAFRFFLNAGSDLRLEALTALWRILKQPGGVLIANVHVNRRSPLGIAYRMRNALTRRVTANSLSLADMRAALVQTGFRVDEVHYYSVLPRLGWWFPRWWEALMDPAERLGQRFRWVQQRAQCFLVVARVR
jgi:trans-aconitate methyltransferase